MTKNVHEAGFEDWLAAAELISAAGGAAAPQFATRICRMSIAG